MSSLTKAPRAPTGGGGLIFSGFGSSFGSGFGTRFLRFGFSFGFSVTSNSSNSLSDFRSAWFEISSFSTFWEIPVCSTSTLSTSCFWIQRTQWSLETQRPECHVVTFTSYAKIKLKPEIGGIPRNGFNRVQTLIFFRLKSTRSWSPVTMDFFGSDFISIRENRQQPTKVSNLNLFMHQIC